MNQLGYLEAELEISRSIKSLLMIVETVDDVRLIHKITAGIPAVLKKATDKRFDLTRSKRKSNTETEEK